MTGRLLHYRSEPLEFEPARTYVHRESWTYGKPDGFWVSVDGQDDWPAWCHSEEFRLGSLRHVYEVTLDPDAKILRLTNPAELEDFHRIYAHPGKYPDHRVSQWGIRWARVSADGWAGIIITPYQWSCRYGMDWYYGWDCASGCIWDLSAIRTIAPVGEIWKFTVPVADSATVYISGGRLVRWLHVEPHGDTQLTLWGIVTPTKAESNAVTVFVRGTRHPMSGHEGEYIGTVLAGPFVWHVFADGRPS